MSVKTRAGLTPSDNEIPFLITTESAETYLQKKFDALTGIMRDNGVNQPDVGIRLMSIRCSNKFWPLLLIMPTSVLTAKGNRVENTDELDIFNPGITEGQARMKDLYHKLIQLLIYDKKDANAWYSRQWRSDMAVGPKAVDMLKNHRIPKVQKYNKGKNRYVICMIDPLRLFHDMLEDPSNDKEDFRIWVSKVNQIKGGKVEYEVCKTSNKDYKNDPKMGDQFINDIIKSLNQ